MPICNECKRFSDCQTVDCCEHCGAKDWMVESSARRFWRVTKKDTANLFGTSKKTDEEDFKPILGVGVVLWAVVVIGLLLGSLWLLIALVKIMWQHS
jgi:hypothetical protein